MNDTWNTLKKALDREAEKGLACEQVRKALRHLRLVYGGMDGALSALRRLEAEEALDYEPWETKPAPLTPLTNPRWRFQELARNRAGLYFDYILQNSCGSPLEELLLATFITDGLDDLEDADDESWELAQADLEDADGEESEDADDESWELDQADADHYDFGGASLIPIRRFAPSDIDVEVDGHFIGKLNRHWHTLWFQPGCSRVVYKPEEQWDFSTASLYTQVRVEVGGKKYQLDFAFIGSGLKLAVEVDGHEWHERTKEQAAHDKERDRLLQMEGWMVMRFTGSEVYADPWNCRDQIIVAIHHFFERRRLLSLEEESMRNKVLDLFKRLPPESPLVSVPLLCTWMGAVKEKTMVAVKRLAAEGLLVYEGEKLRLKVEESEKETP